MRQLGRGIRFAWRLLGPLGKGVTVVGSAITLAVAIWGSREQQTEANIFLQAASLAPWYAWALCGLTLALLIALTRSYLIVEARTSGIEVFLDRHELQRERGSFASELAVVERVWLMCPAASALHEDRALLKKIDRLILTEGGARESMGTYARMVKTVPEAFRATLFESTRFARNAKVEVAWLEHPLVGIVIANPNSPTTAWARLELLLPYVDAALRPSLVVYRSEQPEFFDRLRGMFDECWSVARDPMSDVRAVGTKPPAPQEVLENTISPVPGSAMSWETPRSNSVPTIEQPADQAVIADGEFEIIDRPHRGSLYLELRNLRPEPKSGYKVHILDVKLWSPELRCFGPYRTFISHKEAIRLEESEGEPGWLDFHTNKRLLLVHNPGSGPWHLRARERGVILQDGVWWFLLQLKWNSGVHLFSRCVRLTTDKDKKEAQFVEPSGEDDGKGERTNE